MRLIHLVTVLLLVSCVRPNPPSPTEDTIQVYGTPASGPWLNELFACANANTIGLNLNPQEPDIFLRLGEPQVLLSPAFQIDEEEVLVVVHRESPIQKLSLEATQDLFGGGTDLPAQIWVYSSEEDLQIAFDRMVMQGLHITSHARLAADPQHMSNVLNTDASAVGILTRHWMGGTTREVYSAGTVPVLAITKIEPAGEIQILIACLQE